MTADPKCTQEIIQKAIDTHMATLNLMGTTGMTWWVSSVVFCGSILGGTWLKHTELEGLRYRSWFFAIVLIFFLSIVVYGIWLAATFNKIGAEVERLRILLPTPALSNAEFSLFWGGTIVGTSSFLLIAITWIGIWASITRPKRVR